MVTVEQIKDLVERRDALCRYLAIDDKRIAFEEEQLKTTAPSGLWFCIVVLVLNVCISYFVRVII